MKSTVNRLGKELLMVGSGQVIAALGSIIGVRLMTSVLEPEIYGEVALALTFVALITQTLIGPLSASLTRYYNFAQERGELAVFFGSSSDIAKKIALATAFVFLVGSAFLWLSKLSAYLVLASFTLIFALLSGLNVLLDSVQTAARQRAVVAWHQGISQWLRYLAAVALVLLLGHNPATAMAGYAFSALLVMGSQTYFFQRKFSTASTLNTKPDLVWTTRIVRYSTPFASWGIFTWLQLSSDRWALQTFASTKEVGFYAVLYQLGYYPIVMATNIFAQFVEPMLFRQAGDGTDLERINNAQRKTRWLLIGAFGLTTVAVIAVALLHSFIFQLLAAPAYRPASSLLPIMILSGGLFACGQVASMTQLNRGESKALILPKIITGIIGTLFNIGGAYWMGLPGVVFAGATFSGLYLLWILLISSSAHK